MVLGVLVNFLRAVVVAIVASCKRAACFLQRRRKNSGTLLPLHGVSIGSDAPGDVPVLGSNVLPSGGPEEQPLESWTAWTDDGFESQNLTSGASYGVGGGESAKQHRQPVFGASADVSPDDCAPDYFRDMEPAIQKAAKIVLRKKDSDMPDARTLSSRLSFKDSAAALPLSPDLVAWEDSQNAWEDEDLTGEMTAAARERRRADRERRLMEHQQKKLDKELRRGSGSSKKDAGAGSLIATKLS